MLKQRWRFSEAREEIEALIRQHSYWEVAAAAKRLLPLTDVEGGALKWEHPQSAICVIG